MFTFETDLENPVTFTLETDLVMLQNIWDFINTSACLLMPYRKFNLEYPVGFFSSAKYV